MRSYCASHFSGENPQNGVFYAKLMLTKWDKLNLILRAIITRYTPLSTNGKKTVISLC